MKWFIEALTRKYATFAGRARRKEYWYFILFYCIALFVLVVIDLVAGTFSEEAEIGLFSGLFVLATIVPSIAVTVRRLHDTDRSGWWILISFVPLVGALVLLVFMVLDSQPGANRFGENPKGVMAAGTPAPTT